MSTKYQFTEILLIVCATILWYTCFELQKCVEISTCVLILTACAINGSKYKRDSNKNT